MRKHTDFVLDREGNAVVGAEVYVRKQADNSLVSLYSDDGSTLTDNPCVTDSDGKFTFWTANNTLKLQVFVDAVQEQEVTNIQHWDLDALNDPGTDKVVIWDDSASELAYAAPSTGIVISTTNIAVDAGTTAQILANTADKVLLTDDTWAAADYVALTDGATVTPDLSLGINFSLTIGGNRTLGAPTNTKNGQAGEIIITQDGTGSRTLAYHANWKFVGGSDPVLSTAAGTVDVLSYKVVNSTFIIAALSKAFA